MAPRLSYSLGFCLEIDPCLHLTKIRSDVGVLADLVR